MFCSVVLRGASGQEFVEAVDRRCWCGEWLCLEFLKVVKVLQNYDIRSWAEIFVGCPIFY